MANFVKKNEKLIAFGLTWSTSQNPKKIKDELKHFATRQNADFVISYENDGHSKIGGCSKSHLKSNDVVYSAAVLFAKSFSADDMPSHALLLLPVEDKTALIALENGVPYLDVIVSVNDVIERIDGLEKENGESYSYYGEFAGDLPGLEHFDYDDLLGSGQLKPAKLTKFKKGSPKPLVLITILAAAYFGYDQWNIYQEKVRVEKLKSQAIDPAVVYKNNLDSLLAKASFTGDDAINLIYKPISSVQISSAGWNLKKVTCSRTNCTESWSNTNGSIREFENANQRGARKLSNDGLSFELSTKVLAEPHLLKKEVIPSESSFTYALKEKEESLRKVGIIFKSKPPAIYGVPSEITSDQVPAEMAVKRGELNIEGPLGLLSDALALPTNVAITSLNLKIDTSVANAKFTLAGEYFVQK